MCKTYAPETIVGTTGPAFTVALATSDVVVAYRQLNGEFRVRIESEKIKDLTTPAGFVIRSDKHASFVVHGAAAVTKIVAVCAALYANTP